eukprot:m.121603 g.121603  ORF g.121603 m.121603 type:complete len:423 (+) comp23286_c0_seq1:48-1316(+)
MEDTESSEEKRSIFSLLSPKSLRKRSSTDQKSVTSLQPDASLVIPKRKPTYQIFTEHDPQLQCNYYQALNLDIKGFESTLVRELKQFLKVFIRYGTRIFCAYVLFALVFAVLFSFAPSQLRWKRDPFAADRRTLESSSTDDSLMAENIATEKLDDPEIAGFFARFVFSFCGLLSRSLNTCGLEITPPGATWALFVWSILTYFALCVAVFFLSIFFMRFSVPPAKVIFSKWCVVTVHPSTGERLLQFRVANERGFGQEILQASVSVVLGMSQVKQKKKNKRRFFTCELENPEQPQMPTVWTLTHVIDRRSPFWKKSTADLNEAFADISVVFSAVDPVLFRNIYACHRYDANQIKFNAEFVPVARYDNRAHSFDFDMSKLHNIKAFRKPPTPSATMNVRRSDSEPDKGGKRDTLLAKFNRLLTS